MKHILMLNISGDSSLRFCVLFSMDVLLSTLGYGGTLIELLVCMDVSLLFSFTFPFFSFLPSPAYRKSEVSKTSL